MQRKAYYIDTWTSSLSVFSIVWIYILNSLPIYKDADVSGLIMINVHAHLIVYNSQWFLKQIRNSKMLWNFFMILWFGFLVTGWIIGDVAVISSEHRVLFVHRLRIHLGWCLLTASSITKPDGLHYKHVAIDCLIYHGLNSTSCLVPEEKDIFNNAVTFCYWDEFFLYILQFLNSKCDI